MSSLYIYDKTSPFRSTLQLTAETNEPKDVAFIQLTYACHIKATAEDYSGLDDIELDDLDTIVEYSEPVSVHLYHGRKTLDESLDDWGLDGPTIGPFIGVQLDLEHGLRCTNPDGTVLDLPYTEDMVTFGDVFYGDLNICTVSKRAVGTPLELN